MKYVFALGVIAAMLGCSRDKFTRLEKKSIGKDFVKVTDSLYAGSTEVSNRQYQEFLIFLKKEWREEEFRKFNFDTLGWKSMHAYSEPMFIYYHIHSAYADYPAVNISYEGAIAYCKWLTEEYAKNPKKKYNKVVFRLPTEGEWKFAARGNRDNYTYPWGGPHATNSQGMRLANFLRLYEANMRDTIINGKRMAIGLVGYDFADGLNYDGFTFTPVASYWPNHLGLYNVSGNASEMLSEKGRTKGGNWRSLGYYARIDAPDEFGGQMMEPSPLVGFRVFAEIVE